MDQRPGSVSVSSAIAMMSGAQFISTTLANVNHLPVVARTSMSGTRRPTPTTRRHVALGWLPGSINDAMSSLCSVPQSLTAYHLLTSFTYLRSSSSYVISHQLQQQELHVYPACSVLFTPPLPSVSSVSSIYSPDCLTPVSWLRIRGRL